MNSYGTRSLDTLEQKLLQNIVLLQMGYVHRLLNEITTPNAKSEYLLDSILNEVVSTI